MLIVFIIIYLLFTIYLGFWASKRVKNTQDFALAGRHMPLFVVGSSLFATWFGSETLLGASSNFIDEGPLGLIEDPFGAALCLFLVGGFFARPLYKLNILTFSDFFRIRFSQRTELISAVFMIPSYFTWISAQLLAMAIILHTITGLPVALGVTICAAVVVIYTYLGGMLAVSVTDALQTVVIIIGLGVVIGFLWFQSPQLPTVQVKASDFLPQNTTLSWLEYVAAWMTIGLGSIPQQDVFQRVLSAKNVKTAVYGAHLSGFMYLSIAFMPIAIVFLGKAAYPNLLTSDSQYFIPSLILHKMPLVIQIFFFGALLSAILSTASGAILAPATVVAENLVKPLMKGRISDQNLLKTMRYATVLIAVIACGLSMQSSDITDMVGQSSALSLVSLFVPMVAGLYHKPSNETGALVSMILGTGIWVIFEFFVKTAVPPLLIGLLASILGLFLGNVLNQSKPTVV